jgi:glutathione S-transferase
MAAYLQLAQQQQQQQGVARTGASESELADDRGATTSSTTGGEVFEYIERFLSGSSSSSSSSARKRFVAAVLQHAVQLIQLDPAETAALLLRHQPDQQVPVLVSLQQQPLLQFRFLRAAMDQAMLLQRTQQAAAAAAAGELPSTSTAAAAAAGSAGNADGPNMAAAAAGAERLLLDKAEVADLYVRLLVQFEPQCVMPFLQSHQNYNVAAAIKACAAGGELALC